MVHIIKLKKIKYLLFSITLISSVICFSQKNEGIAIYNAKTNYSFDHIENEKEKQVLKDLFIESGKESSINFTLLFKDEKSVFFAEKALENESIKIDFVSVIAKGLGRIFVNLKTKEVIQNQENFGEVFNIKSSLNNNEWVLTKETIKIGSYTCYKAILKDENNKINETIAWYAPELVYSVGPMGYCGLPGLVVVLQDDVLIFTLKELNFNLSKQEERMINETKKGKEISRKEIDSIYKVMEDREDRLLEKELD